MAKVNFNIGSKGLKMLSAVAGAALTMGVSANSYGALLVDFKPDPSPQNRYEVEYGGTPAQLVTIDGALGNSDIQSAGGLRVEMPFLLDLLPAAYADSVQTNASAGTTVFLDATLVFSNFVAAGSAKLTEIAPGRTLITQLLQTGTFELLSYDPAGDDGKVTLLKGTIENAVISGYVGDRVGGVLSGNVVYDSGVIKDALGVLEGDMSWSLGAMDSPLAVAGASQVLQGFKANLVGEFGFNPIPEPASLSLLGLAGVGILARRRTR